EPEAVGPPLARIDFETDAQQYEPEPDGHDRRPVASVRDEVGDEDPREQNDQGDDQREPKDTQDDGRSEGGDQLERQGAAMESTEQGSALGVQPDPPEPAPQGGNEQHERQDGDEREDTAGDRVAAAKAEGDREKHREDQQRPRRVAGGAVSPGQV